MCCLLLKSEQWANNEASIHHVAGCWLRLDDSTALAALLDLQFSRYLHAVQRSSQHCPFLCLHHVGGNGCKIVDILCIVSVTPVHTSSYHATECISMVAAPLHHADARGIMASYMIG